MTTPTCPTCTASPCACVLDLDAVEARCNAATPGPWRSLRDGNQYLDTRHLPTARLVGASRVEGLPRPWNPHAAIAFMRPDAAEVSRFVDADADFIAAARSDVPALVREVRRLREAWDADAQRFNALLDTKDRQLDAMGAENAALRAALADARVSVEMHDHDRGPSKELQALLDRIDALLAGAEVKP